MAKWYTFRLKERKHRAKPHPENTNQVLTKCGMTYHTSTKKPGAGKACTRCK